MPLPSRFLDQGTGRLAAVCLCGVGLSAAGNAAQTLAADVKQPAHLRSVVSLAYKQQGRLVVELK